MCLVILSLCVLRPGTAWAGTTAQATYARYVQSVLAKDIRAFARTLTSAEAFHYIDSHGMRIDSRREDLMKTLTPILYVDSIELSIDFWVEALGFTKTAAVPEGDALGFAILTSGGIEIMLQSYASLRKDIPALSKKMRGAPSVLFIEVKDIAEIESRLKGYEVVVPRRKTFYGVTEVFYRSPGGHIVGFAEPARD